MSVHAHVVTLLIRQMCIFKATKGRTAAAETNPLTGKPARRPDQPKKVKLRDQKYIPVPESAFIPSAKSKGKARAQDGDVNSDEDGSDMDGSEEEDDFDMLVDDEDPEAMEFLQAGGASFLTNLDEKTISRSKKETNRIHELEKEKQPLPKPTKRKTSPTPSEMTPSDLDSEDMDSDISADDDLDSFSEDDLSEDYEEEERRRAKKKARVSDTADLEDKYEALGRKRKEQAKEVEDVDKDHAEVGHLPIKLANGEIEQLPGRTRIAVPSGPPDKRKKQQQASSDEESVLSDSESEDEEAQLERLAGAKGKFGRLGIADVLTAEMPGLKGKEKTVQRLAMAKEQIAKIGAEIMSGGELIDMVPLLSRLSTFALEKVKTADEQESIIPVPNSVRGLAFLSQLAVYKDLIPGYRIRELTALEEAEKVRDEVRRQREGEKGLVKSYKMYLKTLETEIKRKA